MEEIIRKLVAQISDYVSRDGGFVEYIKYEDNIVYVNMGGACASCHSLQDTFNVVVKGVLMDQVEEIKDVVQVDDELTWDFLEE
jgi:Fe-S cluster biogenesis protein NfuA